MSPGSGTLLSKINSPADLKKLGEEQLPQLCDEIRQFIIEVSLPIPVTLQQVLVP
jgi:deoxyxylulose-5-phosphate synthase